MPALKKYKLKQLTTKIGSGATPRGGDASYKSHGISLIRSQNVLDFTFSKDGLVFIDDYQAKELSNVELKERDVLLNITGDSVARVCQVPNEILPARVNQHVSIVRADRQKLNPEYLKYYFLSNGSKEMLLTLASIGATRKALTKSMIEELDIEIPNEEGTNTQTRIASILSSLDDKIELHRRTNHTLEQIAQTLFKKYFVDDIDPENLPQGWRSQIFSQQFDIDKGLSYKGSGLCDKSDGIPMHNLNSVYEGGGYKYEGLKYYKGEYKERHLINPWDIIVTNTEQGHKYLLIGYPGVVPFIFGSKGIFTHHLYRVRPKTESYLTNQYLYYLIMQAKTRDQIIACTNGTTVNMLSSVGLEKPEFIMPPKEIVEKFSRLITPIWKRKENIHDENEKLVAIRDSLLPKLMSGEIEVNVTEQKLAN